MRAAYAVRHVTWVQSLQLTSDFLAAELRTMWLLSTDRAELHYFHRSFDAKGGYAILSHTWDDEEQSFQDVQAITERCRKNGGSNPRDDRGDDATQRRRKNADAQAAFRAKRRAYTATLEATGTTLLPVVCSNRVLDFANLFAWC